MYYYYTPAFTDANGIRWPGSAEAQVTIVDVDPVTGETTVTGPVTQFGAITIAGGRYFYDETVPRFVVKSPTEQTYSDWTVVTVDQVVADYGSEVV